MASNVPSSAATNNSDPTHTVFGTLESFLQVYGNAEWVSYKRNTAAPHLSYEEWVSSEHVLGPYLYHLTLDAWDEATSSVSHCIIHVFISIEIDEGRRTRNLRNLSNVPRLTYRSKSRQ